MTSTRLMWGLVGLWVFSFAVSWIHASIVPPGSYGLNILFTWFLWQCGALLLATVALFVWFLRRQDFTNALRWIGLVPPVISIGGAVALSIWYFLTE